MKKIFLFLLLLSFSFSAYSYSLLSGQNISLKEIVKASSKEILFFYSTRCSYCSQEIQALNRNCSYLQKEGYKVFFIALPELKRRITRQKERLHLKCPIVLDDGSLMSLYSIFGVPAYIFLYNSRPFGMANSMNLEEIENVFYEEENKQ